MKLDLKILDARMRDYLPKYATTGSAGLDLRACLDAPVTLKPGDTALVPTGSRSISPIPAMRRCPAALGLATSTASARQPGRLIDSDYQGELMISTWNRGQTEFALNPFERLAQLVIVPVVQRGSTGRRFRAKRRGAGGFGSTAAADSKRRRARGPRRSRARGSARPALSRSAALTPERLLPAHSRRTRLLHPFRLGNIA
ncbi:dUTP diphosphatase [Burkholderia pseudomallei]|uniref:dUTP diphosphatase n=1 Tax=Burkholderia pseudomallei TaxID=28450 RepID=UPI0009E4262A